MKRSILCCFLLATSWAARAQLGGTLANEALNMGMGLLTRNPGNNAFQGTITSLEYNNQRLSQQRTSATDMPSLLKGSVYIKSIEQQLAACQQALFASKTAPILVGSHSLQTLEAAVRALTAINYVWKTSYYTDEIAFYQRQDQLRLSYKAALSAARATRQRDSTQVASHQQTAAADPLLHTSLTSAYLLYQSAASLLTEPNEYGKEIGQVAPGSLLSVLYEAPDNYCFVSVQGTHGWLSKRVVAASLEAARLIGDDDLRVAPGYASLQLSTEPALEAVAPSTLPVVAKARVAAAKAKATQDAAKAAAYAKAHPEPLERPVRNNTVYLDVNDKPDINTYAQTVYLTYHVLPTCALLRGKQVSRAAYSYLRGVPDPIRLESCEVCGFYYPSTRKAPGAAHAKAASKPRATHK